MVERGQRAYLDKTLAQILPIVDRIENPVSRADALFLVWQAVYPLGSRLCMTLLEPLLGACQSADSWRAARTLSDTAMMMAADDPKAAKMVIDAMHDGTHKRRALRALANGESISPRRFFW